MSAKLGRTLCVALSGLDGRIVDVEAHISAQLPHFSVTGLPDKACGQAPDRVRMLMGNHEAAMLQHFGPTGPYLGWLNWGGRPTLEQYKLQPKLLVRHLPWMAQRPLLWQNEHVLVSHAGLADSPHAHDPDHADGLLWRRGPLKKLDQLQVVGHTPTDDGEPHFDAATNTLYIDTGACYGRNLSGVRITSAGEVLETVSVPTYNEDLAQKKPFFAPYLTQIMNRACSSL